MKPKIDRIVIDALRKRVIDHNQKVGDQAAFHVKLQGLKTLYKRWHGGKDPHAHALEKIDQHLGQILAKARRPFDEGRHPRGRAGQFRPTGRGGQAEFFGDVQGRKDHRDLGNQNAGYGAFQTAVIPETRYSTFGPPLASAAGITAGAITGAAARLDRGSLLDRISTRTAGMIGRHVIGKPIGHAAGAVAYGLHRTKRGAIQRLNARYAMHIPPGPVRASREFTGPAGQRGGAVGERLATGAGRALELLYTGAPAGMKALAERGGVGTGKARLLGAAVGAIVPGAILYAPTLHHIASTVGPYLDAAYPRRVRKQLGDLLDAPEVLAKQAELLGADDLAKANIAGIARAVTGLGRAGARRLISTLRPAAAAAATDEATGIGPEAARTIFHGHMAAKPGIHVRSMRAARAAVVGAHGVVGGSAGAGVGAISGAAATAASRYWQPDKHPRDEHGRFARRGTGAILGAKIGSAVGLGLGIASGLAAARRGHTELLRAALARLGEQRVGMIGEAEGKARAAHAEAYYDANKNGRLRGMGYVAPGADLHGAIRRHLESRAVEAFNAGPMRAIKGGPEAWYNYQLNQAFDTAARKRLGKLGPIPTKGDQPASKVSNLIENVDEEQLTAGQKKIWKDLVAKHEKARESIRNVWEQRKQNLSDMQSEGKALQTKFEKLKQAASYVPDRAQDLDGTQAPLREIRAFARQHLGADLKARTREDAMEEVHGLVRDFEAKAKTDLEELQQKIGEQKGHLMAAQEGFAQDVAESERMAIVNPFHEGKGEAYFRPIPDPQEALQDVRDRASKAFLREAYGHEFAARGHMESLMAAQQAHLESRVPKTGVTEAAFRHAAPILAARTHQALEDYRALISARRGTLKGTQKQVSDWLQAHKTPKAAWEAARAFNNGGMKHARRGAGLLLENWKSISTLLGLASAVGAIDITAPSGKRVRIKPSTWQRPQNVRLVHEWPDPVKRPNEALFGISYKDRGDGQQKFLQGIHITGAKGEHQIIPFGAGVEQVRSAIRGGGNDSHRSMRASHIDPEHQQEISQTIGTLKGQGKIQSVGPTGAEFRERSGQTDEKSTKRANDLVEKFYKDKLEYAERFKGESDKKADRYWDKLKTLFDSPDSALFSREQRTKLLLGGDGRRGIFANKDAVYGKMNRDQIFAELKRQIAHLGGPGAFDKTNPQNTWNSAGGREDQARLLKKAMWLAAENYRLPAQDRQDLNDAIDQHYRRNTAASGQQKEQPRAEGQPRAGSKQELGELLRDQWIDDMVDNTPQDQRPRANKSDEDFRESLRASYDALARTAMNRTLMEGWDAEKRHTDLIRQTKQALHLGKSEPISGMAKAFGQRNAATDREPMTPPIAGAAVAPRAPRAPRMPVTPGISGAASRPPTPAPPSAPRAGASPGVPQIQRPRTETLGHAVQRAFQPHHFAGQIGSYGLAQAGLDAANFIGRFIPGAGLATSGARFVLGTIGNVGGSIYGQKLGRQAASAAGFKGHDPGEGDLAETGVRGLGGTVGQVYGTKVGVKAGRALGRNLVSRAIGGAARTAAADVGEGIGAAAAEGAGEAAGSRIGAMLGSAVEPGLGTVLGLGIGAGAGWLTDEGVGYLYRHLNRYGPHVAHDAATRLGVPARTRLKFAQATNPQGPTA